MEIHGCDIVVEHVLAEKATLENIVKIVKEWWPDLVTENDESGFFIYKNNEAKESWDKCGWSEVNDKTMIYVIYSGGQGTEDGMTFVIDDNKENISIVNAIKQAIT